MRRKKKVKLSMYELLRKMLAYTRIRNSHVHMTTLWNEIPYTKKKVAKKKSEKINNFYVRQKHACLEARWMCQKKFWMPSQTHTASHLRGKIFFSLFSIIIYFYALSRKQSKKFFSSLMKFRWCWALRNDKMKKIHLWNDGTQHQRVRERESEQIYVN